MVLTKKGMLLPCPLNYFPQFFPCVPVLDKCDVQIVTMGLLDDVVAGGCDTDASEASNELTICRN